MGAAFTPNTTCDIARSGSNNPAVQGVQILLKADFLTGHMASTIPSQTGLRWTHIALMPIGTDIRDGYLPASTVGLEANPTGNDNIGVPNISGTRFNAIFVERVGYGTTSDHLRVYLQRLIPNWPTQNL